MLYTNKFIIILKWRKCNYFFKQLIKGNVKYIKHFFAFRYFILFWETIFWHSIEEKYFMIWYSLEHTTRSPRFFKYCLEVSMNTNQWERLSWKTVYSMILANNNTKWVSSQLFGCGRATRKGTSSPPSVYHWINTSSTCRSHGPSVDPLLSIVCNKVTEEWGETSGELAKEGRSF